jgi:hypothetical protein
MPSGAPQADRPMNNDISVGPTSGASHYHYSGPPRKSAPGEAVTELPGVSDYGSEGGGHGKLHPDQERQNLQEL